MFDTVELEKCKYLLQAKTPNAALQMSFVRFRDLLITSFEIPSLFSKDVIGRQWRNGASCVFEHVLTS